MLFLCRKQSYEPWQGMIYLTLPLVVWNFYDLLKPWLMIDPFSYYKSSLWKDIFQQVLKADSVGPGKAIQC